MDSSTVVDALRPTLPDLLVALDFDGTLAPLRPNPDDSRPVEGALAVLAELSARGAQVAIVTGRDAQTVLRLGDFAAVPGIVVAGVYGIETWHDGALDTPETPAAMRALQQRLPGVLASAGADPAVWIEDKRLSLVVHGRRAEDWEGVLDPLREPVAALADELALELHPGNGVLELRVPGFDKGGALERLADGHRGVLFAGDDLGDVSALEAARAMRTGGRAAYGVAVGSAVPDVAAAADLTVDSPAALVELLRALL